MVGRQFLAIVKSIKEEECISVVEILNVCEEIFFDENSFLQDIQSGNHSPAPMINNQSKFLTFLVCDVENDRQIFRLSEYDLLHCINDFKDNKVKVDRLRKKCYSEMEKELNKINEVQSDIELVQKDIDTHLHNLKNLGYVGKEIKEMLQEFVDEKYPDFGLKIDLK